MKLSLSQAELTTVDVDLLIVPVKSPDFAKDVTFKQLDAELGGELMRIAKLEDFTGKKGQSFTLHTFGKLKARKLRIIAVGGKDKAAGSEEFRSLGTSVARSVRDYKSFAVSGPAEPELVSALAEGFLLGDYRYAEYLTGARKPKPATGRGVLITRSKPDAALRSAVATAGVIAEAVNMARDLVNAPPNEMNPAALAEEAKRVARESGVRCTVWGRAEIVRRGMTLLAAVNAGSDHEARFIHMSYVPRSTRKKLAKVVFVGKGLTFDSGGLSIKPAKSMETMKCDMAGGAATIAIVMAAAKLKLPVEVHGIIPSTDNVINGNAMRPGDIYRTLDGKTVEVLNTDAEGRLILADALTYARDLKPDVLVDHATLTGAVMVALGQWRAGLYATDDALRDRYLAAAKLAGEAFWPLPLDEDIKDTIKSPIADIKNTGDGYGGSIAAALFLREFVGESPWIHLDIAGPAYLSSPHGIMPKGGTGFGVRTALEFIKSYAV
ncbi:MAG: Cytosol aminopeptidase PepA [Myxococcaceae bacterium]|nr:Cytosol aminopeptidase PepA [Myxococcaceae bacterium]